MKQRLQQVRTTREDTDRVVASMRTNTPLHALNIHVGFRTHAKGQLLLDLYH